MEWLQKEISPSKTTGRAHFLSLAISSGGGGRTFFVYQVESGVYLFFLKKLN